MPLQGPVLPLQGLLGEHALWEPPAQVPSVLTPHWLSVVQDTELLLLHVPPAVMVPAAQAVSDWHEMEAPPLVLLVQVPLVVIWEEQSVSW